LLETSRWCDRSIRDVRHSVGPSGTPETATLFGTPVAETILASGHVRPRQQAGHMIASDPIRTLNSSCKPGAVHIWVPDLRSRCALARPGHEGGVAAHAVCSLARSEPRAGTELTMSNSAVFFVPAARSCARVVALPCLVSPPHLRCRRRRCGGGARRHLGDSGRSGPPDEGRAERRQAHSSLLFSRACEARPPRL
jgi:hypothetical protein